MKNKFLLKLLYSYIESNSPLCSRELAYNISGKDFLSEKECNFYRKKIIDYYVKKEILKPIFVKELIKTKAIDKIPKYAKFLYILDKKGIDYLFNLFGQFVGKKYNIDKVILTLDEVFLDINKNISLEHKKISKKRLEFLISSDSIFKIGRNKYVLVAREKKFLKKLLPYYPYITFLCVEKYLFKNKMTSKLRDYLYRIFNNSKIHINDFNKKFKEIAPIIDQEQKLISNLKKLYIQKKNIRKNIFLKINEEV